jgi:hypothetical protein
LVRDRDGSSPVGQQKDSTEVVRVRGDGTAISYTSRIVVCFWVPGVVPGTSLPGVAPGTSPTEVAPGL